MSIKKLSVALITSTVVSFAAGVRADATPSPEPCTLDKLGAVSATEYRTEQDLGYNTYSPQSGVQLYVPAREGLTAEWLTLSFQRALSTQAGNRSVCRPAVRDVNVAVVSAGPGFWVYLSAPDQHAARTLVRWARALVAQPKAPLAAD